MKAMYREALPGMWAASGGPGGIELILGNTGSETYMVFHKKLDMPHFATFGLMRSEEGRWAILEMIEDHCKLAVVENNFAHALDTPTWRASPEWTGKLGMDWDEAQKLLVETVSAVEAIRKRYAKDAKNPILIGGVIGPRGDAYAPASKMTAEESMEYHSKQIAVFAKETAVDYIEGYTMTYADEAIGMVKAAKKFKMPVILSFTVETDGRLPSGQPLKDTIELVDKETDGGPEFYMINCAHPSHFMHLFEGPGEPWMKRFGGVLPNSSTKSHAELDDSETLDEGDVEDLGKLVGELHKNKNIHLKFVGGCCGTDIKHLRQIAQHLG